VSSPRERENECARTRIIPRQAVGAPAEDRDSTKTRQDSSGAHLPRPDAETRRQLSRYGESDRREQDAVSHYARKTAKERQCGGKIFTAASGPPRDADVRTVRCCRRLSEKENKSKHGGAESSVDGEETTATTVAAQPRRTHTMKVAARFRATEQYEGSDRTLTHFQAKSILGWAFIHKCRTEN
jgi:hypothetical protein